MNSHDFFVTGGPSVFLLIPISDEGAAWIDEHIPEDALHHGNGIAVEWRYIKDIVVGIQNDGLSVTR